MRIASNLLKSKDVLAQSAFLIAMTMAAFPATGAFALDLPAQPVAAIPAPIAPLALPGTDQAAPKAAGSEMNKAVAAMEEKAIDSAKSVTKRLETSSDSMTLEDLNNARQTVARIDAMIEVEKHLAELEKLRGDKANRSAASAAPIGLASAIPASALMLPPAMASSSSSPSHAEPTAHRMTSAGTEVSRITGIDGRYTAVLKINGETRMARVGDKLSNGAIVKSISSSSVGLDDGGESRVLRIKNVDAIYSAMR